MSDDLEFPSGTALDDDVGKLTEPMARKKEKVAALLSMYCESVGRTPRGPAPPLINASMFNVPFGSITYDSPQNAIRAEDETNCEPHSTTHERPHSGARAKVSPVWKILQHAWTLLYCMGFSVSSFGRSCGVYAYIFARRKARLQRAVFLEQAFGFRLSFA